jgi:hypothetical protein
MFCGGVPTKLSCISLEEEEEEIGLPEMFPNHLEEAVS